jgi:hypothetical protein
MFNKTTFAFLAAILLSTGLPASAATKHHSVPSAAGGGCTASGGPACSSACTGSGPCAPPDRW